MMVEETENLSSGRTAFCCHSYGHVRLGADDDDDDHDKDAFVQIQIRKRIRMCWLVAALAVLLSALIIWFVPRRRWIGILSRIEKWELPTEVPSMAPSASAAPSFTPLAPLDELVSSNVRNREDVYGDVSALLDFAIVGFAKCGTTFMKSFLNTRNSFVFQDEICLLSKNRPATAVRLFYDVPRRNEFGEPIRVGTKCPKELQTSQGLANYARYFPRTNFIVMTRHPVHWFRSFYNFRIYHRWPDFNLEPLHCRGPCEEDSPYVCEAKCAHGKQNLCTDRANFHHALSRFGKTPMNTANELRLLNHHNMSVHPVEGKIFLMEIRQLDVTMEASRSLTQDLGDFLKLRHGLPHLPSNHTPHVYNHTEAVEHFVDICDDMYLDLRHDLMRMGKNAAHWIRNYFMKSPDVVVSSPKEFLRLIADWSEDPCLLDDQ